MTNLTPETNNEETASETPPEEEGTQEEESRMPLTAHLEELRSCMVHSIVAVLVGVLITFSFSEHIVEFLKIPLLKVLPEGQQKLYYIGVEEKFMVYLKVSIVSAIALVFPYLLYQVWRFIAPGLYQREKRLALPFLFLGTLSFGLGVSFAYFVAIPLCYEFLINFGSGNDEALITLTKYYAITSKMLLGLGLLFLLPIAIVLLGMLGVLEADTLVKHRKNAVVGLAILAAIVTPSPDAFTMVVVMGPLWVLYELSIIGVRFFNKKQAQQSES